MNRTAGIFFRRTYSDQWDGMHDYDFDTPFFATCGYCGWDGPSRDTRREAERDRLGHPDVLCWIRALWIDWKPVKSGEARR